MRKGYISSQISHPYIIIHGSCRSAVRWWDNTILALLASDQPFKYNVAFVKHVHFG